MGTKNTKEKYFSIAYTVSYVTVSKRTAHNGLSFRELRLASQAGREKVLTE